MNEALSPQAIFASASKNRSSSTSPRRPARCHSGCGISASSPMTGSWPTRMRPGRCSTRRSGQAGSGSVSTASIARRQLIMPSSSGGLTYERPGPTKACWFSTREALNRGRPPARPGVSAAHDSYRPIAKLPDELLGAVLLQPAHAERHSTLLATGRVWKTHVIAGSRPDQVTISFGADPTRELVWSWTTSTSVQATALRIAPANPQSVRDRKIVENGAIPANVRVVTGEATALKVLNLLNDPVVLRHRVAVDRLEPDTTYLYSPGDGSKGGWGPWRAVKTAPSVSRRPRFSLSG